MAGEKSRQSNIELLRIVAMIMIIFHHIGYFSGFAYDPNVIGANRLITQFITYGGHVGVDVFVLISGYFLISSELLKLVKIIKIWLQMIFYSLLGLIIGVLFFGYTLTPKAIGIALIPFLYKQWPFASAYLVIMIIAPFINKLIAGISKGQYRIMLAVMLILWSVIPTITTFDAGSNYVIWMMVLYCLGGYVKLYEEDFRKNSGHYLLAAAGMAVLSLGITVVLDILGLKWSFFATYAMHFSGKQHINVLLWAFFMMLGFLKLNIRNSAFINYIAGLTFGIYLFHEDYYLREGLWKQLFRGAEFADEWYLLFYIILQVVIVFVVGSIIDVIRKFFEKYVIRVAGRMLEPVQKKVDEDLCRK